MKALILLSALIALPAMAADIPKHPRYGWPMCAGLPAGTDCEAMMKMAQDIINNKSRYRCHTVDRLRKFFGGGGLVVHCNGPSDIFEIEQKGGIWSVTLDD